MFNTRLFVVVILAFFIFGGCGKKTEKLEIRNHYSQGRIDNLSAQELELEKTIREASKLPAAIEYAKGMFEAAYLIAEEHRDLGFTVYFKDQELIVERGLKTSLEPTLVVPLSDQGIFNAKLFFDDGMINEQEEFLIVNATFKPAWEASYRITEMQNYGIRKLMKLDGLMHVVLLNEKNYEFKGKVVKNELSVLRLSNQWLVFNGLEGIADVRMEITPKHSIAMYKLIMNDLKKSQSLAEKMKILKKFQEIRNRCLVKKSLI
ncbi:MAG: hypothetical protein ABII74_09710 [Elusimicrobiota bacterium]